MKKQKGFTLVEVALALFFVCWAVAIIGGGGYVAYHFISKWW
jgi:Tfp pilus assembly protein PilV